MANKCITCKHFRKLHAPKESWNDRYENAKKMFTNVSDKAAAALANSQDLWEQEETGKGFCSFHVIDDQIPNHMSCDDHTNN